MSKIQDIKLDHTSNSLTEERIATFVWYDDFTKTTYEEKVGYKLEFDPSDETKCGTLWYQSRMRKVEYDTIEHWKDVPIAWAFIVQSVKNANTYHSGTIIQYMERVCDGGLVPLNGVDIDDYIPEIV